MNKKIFILPLAVGVMGLASCNNSWPSKTIDEADAIGKKIYAEDEWANPSSDEFNTVEATSIEKKYTKIGKGYSDKITIANYYVDATGGYAKEATNRQTKSEDRTAILDEVIYNTIIDNKGYELNKHRIDPTKDYTYTSYDTTKENYAKKAKIKVIEKYKQVQTNTSIIGAIKEFKTYIEGLKTSFEIRFKDAKKIECNYTFNSKNDKSLKFKFEGKVWNFTDTTGTEVLPIVDYCVSSTEITIEDLHLTSYSFIDDVKGKAKSDNKEYDAQITKEEKMNLSFKKPSHDSINLSDYILVS